ncbi:DUF4623 domain-containing protein [Fontivita pretiosa]|uniref:DUF4623 domain-containing protein n=1 Tax=Fontivita pretiosa TaxID=2989684 RepID=UPI003D1698D7
MLNVRFRAATVGGCLALGSVAMAAPMYSLDPLTSFGGGDGYLAPGDRAYLTTDNTQRGLAYNPINDHVYIVNRAGGLSVQILDGTTGADLGTLNTTGITGGTFVLSTIAVGEDGAIYAANLTTNSSSSPLKIYRWNDELSAPTVAFSGAPAGAVGARFGDNLAARGSGASTQLLMGGNNGAGAGSITYNSYAVFSTADGLSFSGTGMSITGPANGSHRLGIAFAAGNTVYGKQTGAANNLEYSTFDLALGTASRNSGAPFTLTASGEALLAVDVANTLLATADVSSGMIRLYDILDNTVNPVLLDSEAFPGTHNANTNGTGQMVFGNGRLYVLESNNGVRVFAVVPEPSGLTVLGLGLSLLRRRRC